MTKKRLLELAARVDNPQVSMESIEGPGSSVLRIDVFCATTTAGTFRDEKDNRANRMRGGFFLQRFIGGRPTEGKLNDRCRRKAQAAFIRFGRWLEEWKATRRREDL